MRLQAVSSALAAAYTEKQVGAVALEAVFGALAPRGAGVVLLDGSGTMLEIAEARGYPPDMIERYRRIPLDAPIPASAAVRSGRPVIFESREERRRNYPAIDRELAETRSGAIAALPLIVHGKVLGVLTLSFADERVIPEADRAFMLTVASQCAQALERARLFDAERRAREQAEASLAALQASELRFRTVFESRMLGIAFWDGERVSDANAAFLDLLGFTEEDLRSGEIRHGRLSPPEYRDADLRATEESRARGSCTPYEKEFFRKDGTRVPVLVGGTLLRDGTGVFFVLDMTAHREAIEQLQASQRMEAVGRLAGGVAHEINNALQGVLGFSRFVAKALDPADPVRADVDQIERSARRAAEITQQLLAYSRRQLLRPAAHDLAAIVASFEPMMRQALGPGRRLEVRVPGGPVTILADRGQIEQVLLNLTLNARDAMRGDGELVVEIGTSESAAGPGRSARYVTLTVSDNGHGMDGRTLSQIFDPFFTTKAPGEGTGLGLAVVQGIVRQSGGQIFASSEPGRGATFRILLPAAGPELAPPPHAEKPALPRGGETVLLVEDEDAVRSYIGRLLRELGYHVIEAATPDAALAALDGSGRGGAPVSLIVSDVLMPAGGGEAVGKGAEAWASRLGVPAVPIVYVSGQSDEQTARRELAGRAAFLQKPFDADDLARTVRALLDGART
ncbi:MAG TPA: ATP-binding protein [Gemmatimonadales bacterium]